MSAVPHTASDQTVLPRLKDLAPIVGNHYLVSGLSSFERALLATDGTFTVLLEALKKTQIDVIVSRNAEVAADKDAAEILHMCEGDVIWRREVNLVQSSTGEPLVYACSIVDPSVFTSDQQDQLVKTKIGLGRVIASMEAISCRRLLGFAMERGGGHLQAFGLPDDTESLCKSYTIEIDGKPAAFITEKMPRPLFSESEDAAERCVELNELGRKKVLLGLGSNQGNRIENFVEAVAELRLRGVELIACSAIYETSPVGMLSDKQFANAVAVATFDGSFAHLLSTLQEVERTLGRKGGRKWADRPIDLDILFAGDTVIDTPTLQIPHPLAVQRPFVVGPLLEVCPNAVDPTTSLKVSEVARDQVAASSEFQMTITAEEFLAAVEKK